MESSREVMAISWTDDASYDCVCICVLGLD